MRHAHPAPVPEYVPKRLPDRGLMLSLLRVFDVMCWMFSWEGDHGPCSQEMPD